MIKFFKNDPMPGKPISISGFAAGLFKIAKALERMKVDGGRVDWLDGVPMIIVDGASGSEGGADLPEGGEQYQVLQRDSGGDAVWDWVRAADVSE